MKTMGLITGLLLIGTFCSAQALEDGFTLSKLDLPGFEQKIFDPSFTIGNMDPVFSTLHAKTQPSLVFKTPVHYEAFFCKLEVATQQKLGIMIQFHVGDYNSRMDQIIPR